MNNLRKATVVLLIATLTFSMFFVPFAVIPNARPQVTAPEASTPQQVLENWNKYIEDTPHSVLDSVLASYRDTGEIPLDVAINGDGHVGVILTVSKDADLTSLENLVDATWKVDFKAAYIMSGYVDSRSKITELENFDGIVHVFADRLFRDRPTVESEKAYRLGDMETSYVSPPDAQPDMYEVRKIMGIDDAYTTYGYDGDGVRVGLIDTGVDFAHPDLKDAVDFDPDGLSTSFDFGGLEMAYPIYRANATNVNATEWLAYSSWNLLSYTNKTTGKTYIMGTYPDGDPRRRNGTIWDPYVNSPYGWVQMHDYFFDGYLDIWYHDYDSEYGEAGFGYSSEKNLTDFYYSVMVQDIELPDPSQTLGNDLAGMGPYYCVGWVMQHHWNPYMKVFAPMTVLNGDEGMKIYVDWNTTRCFTEFWNWVIFLEAYDFNDPASGAYFEGLGDWSFVDDAAKGLWYNTTGGLISNDHAVLSYDYDGDGVDDFGLGVLGHGMENIFG
ncbi:MAG: hypothetical protein ACFFER_03435, partial [Candidatus Thorarchaeota archaeon]